MKKENLRTVIAAACGMLVLILDGRTALHGAQNGITLCITTLIPSLFPFFLLSILLTGALSGQNIAILRPIADLCKIPKGAESLLAVGLLGGYPVGAQSVATLHRHGCLSDNQASRMIAICNHAGPAFIFGVLGGVFSQWYAPWLLWAIHMISAVAVGWILPDEDDAPVSQAPAHSLSVTHALEQAIKIMSLVCGWVILMRTMLAIAERWFLWLLPPVAQVTLAGILELSNGCIRLPEIENEGVRFMIAGVMLSLGGICVTLQTASVAKEISMKSYFPGKILQCCISAMLCCILQAFVFSKTCPDIFTPIALSICIGLGCILVMHTRKNSSRIPTVLGV